MANNRMYIRCRYCGEVFYLAQNWCSGWKFVGCDINGVPFETRIGDFFKKHYNEHLLQDGWSENCFEIAYEEDGKEIDECARRLEKALNDLEVFKKAYKEERETRIALARVVSEQKDKIDNLKGYIELRAAKCNRDLIHSIVFKEGERSAFSKIAALIEKETREAEEDAETQD